MWKLLICITLFVLTQAADKPNILFILVDDLGWNDVSWHDSGMQTPFLETLASSNAAVFQQSYVDQLCTQTRSALMTGRYAYTMGLQDGVFAPTEPSGVPTDIPFFPEYFDQQGYETYMLGKWHLGHCKTDYLPTKRGFKHFLGFYTGGEDYFTHMSGAKYENQTIEGLDFWFQDEPAFSYSGKYSTEIYADQAVQWLSSHDPNVPFFFYMSFQAVHYPLQVPDSYMENCKQTYNDRKIYCGIMYALDVAVERIVNLLKERNLYEDTIIIFSTDNGANVLRGGNNLPYRGNKGTLFEGGTKANHFVHSPKYITNPGDRNQLFHVVDWYATLLNIAGASVDSHGDGINQWPMMQTGEQAIQRDTLVYNIAESGSAIRKGKYKYMVGNTGKPTGWKDTDGEWINQRLDRQTMHHDGQLVDHFLWDLDADPTETKNLFFDDSYGDVVAEMDSLLSTLKAKMVPSIHKSPEDSRGLPSNHNGTFASGWC